MRESWHLASQIGLPCAFQTLGSLHHWGLSLVCFQLTLHCFQEHNHGKNAKYLSCPFHIVYFYEELQDLPECIRDKVLDLVHHTMKASTDLEWDDQGKKRTEKNSSHLWIWMLHAGMKQLINNLPCWWFTLSPASTYWTFLQYSITFNLPTP